MFLHVFDLFSHLTFVIPTELQEGGLKRGVKRVRGFYGRIAGIFFSCQILARCAKSEMANHDPCYRRPYRRFFAFLKDFGNAYTSFSVFCEDETHYKFLGYAVRPLSNNDPHKTPLF